MKIAFLDVAPMRYTPATPLSQPLGGTQSAACYLSTALADRGHDVALITMAGDKERVLGVSCLARDTRNPAEQLNAYDAVVVLTSPIAAELRRAGVTTRLVNWQHKTNDNVSVGAFAEPEERASWSATVFVSQFQRDTFVEKWGMNGMVLRNAMSPALEPKLRTYRNFVERGDDPVLAYASAPGRGLDFLLMSFPTIRKALPGAKLKIFSDQAMYQVTPEKDEYSVYYEVARQLPGVEYIGGVSQSTLVDEFLEADIWTYPTTFVETSCIVMMEAGAAGCLLLTSDIGALKESSGKFGRLMRPGFSRAAWSGSYARGLVAEVRRIRDNPEAHNRFIERQMTWFRTSCTWSQRAREWEAWLEADLMSPEEASPQVDSPPSVA
jgi:glycosyltransferase involved in cell wall biosynthesis